MTEQLLDNLPTPAQIAERITASTGIRLTARTVWEKAKRLGIAKKIGRSMLISVEDIPLLLREETREERRERSAKMRTGDALAILRRASSAKK